MAGQVGKLVGKIRKKDGMFEEMGNMETAGILELSSLLLLSFQSMFS